MTICSRTTRMGTSTPYGARNGRVHTPVATTTVPAETSVPSAQPHARHAVAVDQQVGHRGALPDPDAGRARRGRERLRGL